ncbi:S8 family serine peptidase [Streptomyces sp. NPDC050264]|uniref:S8 family serine peptidase n=1 Tax=Streptomyces sp. NPDC050264 TaxID=3155038 RepID=UPI00341527A5
MDANAIWKVSTGKGVKVAVIDSGISDSTPSLKGQVLVGEVPQKVAYGATKDYVGHGTTMAELIAGTGAGGGLKGLAPGAKIIPFRVQVSEMKDKAEQKKTAEPAEAIRAAADTDAKIINMSFGQDLIDPDTEAAVKYAQSKGKLLFAAVGNDAEKKNSIGYPAAYDNVVGVAASDETGKVGKFSEHGSFVDLAAPGLHLPEWCDATLASYCSDAKGTSSASALASASAALIWSAHPDWTNNQVLRVLTDTASRSWPKDTPSNYLGYGLIRPARNLLHNEGQPGTANVDPITNQQTTETGSGSDTPSSTSASGSSQPSQKASDVPAEAAGSEAKSSSDSNTLWIALGAIAAVIVVGGVGFAVMRARRS